MDLPIRGDVRCRLIYFVLIDLSAEIHSELLNTLFVLVLDRQINSDQVCDAQDRNHSRAIAKHKIGRPSSHVNTALRDR